MKSWEYRKSRGEQERARKKHTENMTTRWDFDSSLREEEGRPPDTGTSAKLLSEGWAWAEPRTEIAILARNLGLKLEDLPPTANHSDLRVTWVPVWFTALYTSYVGIKQVAGAATEEFARAAEALRNDSREQFLIVAEFLLVNPYAGDASVAAKAFVDRYVRAHPSK
jgi:hypothetical protein